MSMCLYKNKQTDECRIKTKIGLRKNKLSRGGTLNQNWFCHFRNWQDKAGFSLRCSTSKACSLFLLFIIYLFIWARNPVTRNNIWKRSENTFIKNSYLLLLRHDFLIIMQLLHNLSIMVWQTITLICEFKIHLL